MSDNENPQQIPAMPAGIEQSNLSGGAGSWFNQNRRTVLIGGAVVVIVVAAIISFSVGGDDKDSAPANNGGATASASNAPVNTDGLKALVTAVGGAGKVFWAGEEAGSTYVLRTEANGQASVRYIPSGGDPNAQGAVYRVLGSYPIKGAFDVTKKAAEGADSVLLTNSDGSIVVYNKNKTTNVYIAFPDVDVQIEIFDPTPGKALELATSGRIVKVA